MSEIRILKITPTLDHEFPTRVEAERNGETFVVYDGHPRGRLGYFHPNGHPADGPLTADISGAIAKFRTNAEIARRASRIAELERAASGASR